MPSPALISWQIDRRVRLGLADNHCRGLMLPTLSFPAPGTAPTPTPAFAEESLQGFVMLLSGHFQGFCRDLYTSCSQLCVAEVPRGLQITVQAQFDAELKLSSSNPTVDAIRKDFERFGIKLDLKSADAGNENRMTHLGHLNAWRNAIAHQSSTPLRNGVPGMLTLGVVRDWLTSCDGLAGSLDDIMFRELSRILGRTPW